MSEDEKIVAAVDSAAIRPRGWALNVIAIAVILGLLYLGELVLVTILLSVLITFILAPLVEGRVASRVRVWRYLFFVWPRADFFEQPSPVFEADTGISREGKAESGRHPKDDGIDASD